MDIQPIETHYKGYRFRSRLEARWAVFFDKMKVNWDYEVEGFRSGDIFYLPDFVIMNEDNKIFIEIKPITPTDEELEKAKIIAVGLGEVVVIMVGDPYRNYHEHEDTGSLVINQVGEILFLKSDIVSMLFFVGILTVTEFEKLKENLDAASDDKERERISFWALITPATISIMASRKSRSARFEFGESG